MCAMRRSQLGSWGEEQACRALHQRGYAILERRYRTRYGEIDIVARDSDVLVFVEVKTRRTETHGRPAEAVTWHKQRRLVQLAAAYLALHRLSNVPCRFDVVTVTAAPGTRRPTIEVLQAAFDRAASP